MPSCSRPARRTTATARRGRSTTTSSWRRTSTRSSSKAGRSSRSSEQPLRERRLQKLLRDEGAAAAAEAGPRPRARADVPQTVDRRAVAGALRERAPEEVLVEAERAAVRIAAHEVDVQ